MKVSVIIPMYNAEKYVVPCFNSIAEQTLKDIEVIAVDDGSSDRTLDVAKAYIDIIPNLKIIESGHFGPGFSRNIGLSLAKGEYIKFVDIDDSLANNNTLKTMYERACYYGADVLVGKYYTYMGRINLEKTYRTMGMPKSGLVNLDENKEYPFQEMPGIGDKFFKREHIGTLKFPNTKWEDLAFTPVLLADAKKLYFLDEVVYNYRMRINNTSIKTCLFSSNIFQFFDVYEHLNQEFVNRNIKEKYEKELLGLFSLHGHFDAAFVPVWLNMKLNDKRNLLKYFITKLESVYPNFRHDPISCRYFSEHLPSQKLFEYADSLAQQSNILINDNTLDQDINRFVKNKIKKK